MPFKKNSVVNELILTKLGIRDLKSAQLVRFSYQHTKVKRNLSLLMHAVMCNAFLQTLTTCVDRTQQRQCKNEAQMGSLTEHYGLHWADTWPCRPTKKYVLECKLQLTIWLSTRPWSQTSCRPLTWGIGTTSLLQATFLPQDSPSGVCREQMPIAKFPFRHFYHSTNAPKSFSYHLGHLQ
jgi:hypothetical protein